MFIADNAYNERLITIETKGERGLELLRAPLIFGEPSFNPLFPPLFSALNEFYFVVTIRLTFDEESRRWFVKNIL